MFSPQLRVFALDEGQPFGYSDREPLKISIEDNGETFSYAFLPPLSQDALEAACREDGTFLVESLAVGERPGFDDKKLSSISIKAKIINNGRELNINKRYQRLTQSNISQEGRLDQTQNITGHRFKRLLFPHTLKCT